MVGDDGGVVAVKGEQKSKKYKLYYLFDSIKIKNHIISINV